jgi:hypothetical protein
MTFNTSPPTSRTPYRRLLLGIAAASIAIGGMLGLTARPALAAIWAYSSTAYGNGHNGVAFGAHTELYYNSAPAGWNAGVTQATMWVTNSGDARCDRSRLFSSGWTQIGNKNWAGAPFPFTQSSGSQYDYFTWDYPAASWALRSWWQIDDAFVGGVCDYGGGVGIYQQGYGYPVTTETVPSP